MTTISLCMIVNNNSDTLENCLNSIKDLVDEIIIVDTGSTDFTKDIASDYTENVFNYNAVSNADAKNYAFSKATMDYIMWLNPNEILTDLNRKYFKDFKSKLKVNYDAIMMKNEISFDKNGHCNQWNYCERLVKRIKNFKWQGDFHEFLVIMGSITYSDVSIQRIQAQKKIKVQTTKCSTTNDDTSSSNNVKQPEDMLKFAKEHYDSDEIIEAINWLNKFITTDIDNIYEKVDASMLLAECHKINQDELSRLKVLINTLSMDVIHPNIFYCMANYFYDHQTYLTAITWYKSVLDCKKIVDAKVIDVKEYQFKAYIGICESYKHLSNNEKALVYHKKSKKLRPKDIKVIENDKYFEKIKEQTTV